MKQVPARDHAAGLDATNHFIVDDKLRLPVLTHSYRRLGLWLLAKLGSRLLFCERSSSSFRLRHQWLFLDFGRCHQTGWRRWRLVLGDEFSGRGLVLFWLLIRFFMLILAVRQQVQSLCIWISDRLLSSSCGYLLFSFFIVTSQLGLLKALLKGIFGGWVGIVLVLREEQRVLRDHLEPGVCLPFVR